MFERTDIEKFDFDESRIDIYRGLYSSIYRQFAFLVPDSEENIRITRSPKLKHDNGARFWIAAELQEDWNNRMEYFKPYILASDFRPLSEDEFNKIVSNQCGQLITKPELPLNKGRFIGAMAMCTMERGLIVDLFAEYENEYIHFLWESTA